jgi:ParB-like chromosome segregation protein Spo0J
MAGKIKQGFQQELIELAVEGLFSTKNISLSVKHGRKYAQVLSSIREVGLIEAPVVAPITKGEGYILLDGHLRIMALKELGIERVHCLISTDDESYTYNKYINRLSAIQEHRMIVKALQSGVSEEKLASALNLDRKTLREKQSLIDGICSEAVDLLKDKVVSERVFRALKKMKAPRQITVAMLMNDQNRFTANYVKALLEATPTQQLVNKGNPKKTNPATLARQARLEEESLALSKEMDSLKDQYGAAIMDMTSMQAYLKRLLGNEAVAKYLHEFNEPIYDKFREIVDLDCFKLRNL